MIDSSYGIGVLVCNGFDDELKSFSGSERV